MGGCVVRRAFRGGFVDRLGCAVWFVKARRAKAAATVPLAYAKESWGDSAVHGCLEPVHASLGLILSVVFEVVGSSWWYLERPDTAVSCRGFFAWH